MSKGTGGVRPNAVDGPETQPASATGSGSVAALRSELQRLTDTVHGLSRTVVNLEARLQGYESELSEVRRRAERSQPPATKLASAAAASSAAAPAASSSVAATSNTPTEPSRAKRAKPEPRPAPKASRRPNPAAPPPAMVSKKSLVYRVRPGDS